MHHPKKTNLSKLAKFKKNNPDFTCIYATINDSTEIKTIYGCKKRINDLYYNVEIEQQIGYEFLTFIFGKHTNQIIDFVKETIDKYTDTYTL
jgi:hypothetical protein